MLEIYPDATYRMCRYFIKNEVHVIPIINDGCPHSFYLFAQSADHLDPFLPVLTELIESGGSSLFVALVTLNLMEVSPKPAHLGFMVAATKVWLTNYPDDPTFWVDHGIGRRICMWINAIREPHPISLDATHTIRIDIDSLLAALVSLGVVEARHLEEELAR